jgi:hypothetical protein
MAGWTLKRIKGSHHIFGKPETAQAEMLRFTCTCCAKIGREQVPFKA